MNPIFNLINETADIKDESTRKYVIDRLLEKAVSASYVTPDEESAPAKPAYSYAAPNTTTITAMRSDFWKKFYPTFASYGLTKRGPGSLNEWEKGYISLDCVKSNRGDRSHVWLSLDANETRITFCNHIPLTSAQKASIENDIRCSIKWATKRNGKLKASVVLPASCWKNAAEWQKVVDTAVKLRDALAPYAYV